MINLIKNRIVKHFHDKAVTQINTDATSVAKQHFGSAISMLSVYGEIKSLFWVGSYGFNLDMIEYFKKQNQVDNFVFDKKQLQKEYRR